MMFFLIGSCLLLPALVVSIPVHEQYKGATVYHVQYDKSVSLQAIEHLGNEFDIWKEPNAGSDQIDVMVEVEQQSSFREFVKEHGLKTSVMIEDVGKLLVFQKIEQSFRMAAGSSQNFNYDEYHPLNEVEEWMRDMAREHSNLLTIVPVSRSYLGKTINAFKVSTGGGNKPVMWVDGGIHSREWVAPATMMYFVKYFVEGYRNDAEITDLLDRADWYILPVVNVDGYEYTWSSDRLWRKTRSPNPGSSCVGCDPNRNWDQEFGGPGTSTNPCSNTYPGQYAFSEIEVKNMVDYVRTLGEVRMYLAYHSYGQMYMAPYGHTYIPNPDFEAQMEICNAAITAITWTHGAYYRCDSLINLVGPNSGSSADYMYNKMGVKYSFGVELRDTGSYGFLLPANQIRPTAEENFNGVKVMASRILDER